MLLEVLQNRWVRAGALLGAICGIAVVLYLLSAVLVPLFFAFIVAYIFDPVIDKIETYKISRVGAIVTLVGAIMLAGIIVPLTVLPGVIRQAYTMMAPPEVAFAEGEDSEATEALHFRGRVAQKVEDWFLLDDIVLAMGWVEIENGASSADAEGESGPGEAEAEEVDVSSGEVPAREFSSLAVIRQKVGEKVLENTDGLFQSLFPQWQTAGSSVLRMTKALGDIFLSLFLFVGNFVLFAFVAIYLLKDYDHIVAYGDSLVPHRHRLKVRDVMGRIDMQLRAFLRGQFMVCCCLGAMYAIGLTIAGAPFALLLALFGALASFVPYLGLILTIGPAVILTVLYHGGVDWHVLGVLATFAIAQFLEGNFLTPKIVGSQVGLGPVWVILAIMIFGSTLGFIGLLLAVPIAAVLKVLAEEALAAYRRSDYFSGADSGPA